MIQMKGNDKFKVVGVPMASGLLRLWFEETYIEPVKRRGACDDDGRRLVISHDRSGEPHLFRFAFKADPTSPAIVGSVKDLFQEGATYRQGLNDIEYRLMLGALGNSLGDKAHLLDQPNSPLQRPTHPRFPYTRLVLDKYVMCRINLQRRLRLRTDKALYACVAFLLAATGANPSEQLDLFCLSYDLTPLPRVRGVEFTSEMLSSEAVSFTIANLYYVVGTTLREAMEQFQPAV
jgi:hypothetical protein